jgi:beta-N-acetylhexosaminidase
MSRHGKICFFAFLVLSVLLVTVGVSRGWWSAHATHQSRILNAAITPQGQSKATYGHKGYQQVAARYLSRMTLDEKLGQLFMVSYEASTYSSDLDRMISKLHAGGVILYQSQIKTITQTKKDIARMQEHATVPLFISTDEEGGSVDRLTNIYPPRPSARSLYQTNEPDAATQAGHQTAHDLQELGFNENLAPDSDVQLIDGPDQDTRTFGSTPRSVITFAGAYMRAVQQDGVIACVKHFPGLGAASTDAHLGLPVVSRTKSQIYAIELAPFKAFVQTHDAVGRPGMVMSTDVLMPAIDPQFPAELSHTFITDILRKLFGYKGVVITDSLSMLGISQSWDIAQSAVMALNAGNDMLMGVSNEDEMAHAITALKSALQQGRLSQARVDEAVMRILMLKLQYHLASNRRFASRFM